MPYFLLKVFWWVGGIISLFKMAIMLWMYKRHLKKRIEKNNFGRNEEW